LRTGGGLRTFNISTANAGQYVLEVYKPELVNIVAEIVASLKYDHVLVVHGLDGLDEISPIGNSRVASNIIDEVLR